MQWKGLTLLSGIHAATMVTAGIYMHAFHHSTLLVTALTKSSQTDLIAFIGASTAEEQKVYYKMIYNKVLHTNINE